jgi:hypothetical protein
MPRIAQYNAPTEALTESTRGAAAFEQAGRRLGPLYNEAATFEKEQGTAAAQGITQSLWPYNIARLLATQNNSGGFNVRVSGANRGIPQSKIGLPDNSTDATDQISKGAGALGNALRDGGYTLATAKPGDILTEEGGRLITQKQSQDLFNKYNTMLDDRGTEYMKQMDATQAFWQKYNNTSPYATDQSNNSSTGPNTDFAGGSPAPSGAGYYSQDTTSTGAWSGLSSSIGSGTTEEVAF